MGLYLLRMKRNNPATGREDNYYRLSHKEGGIAGKPVTLGFLPGGEEEAQLLLAQYRLKMKKGEDPLGLQAPPAPKKEEPKPPAMPTIREWWGEGKPWPQSRIHQHFLSSGLAKSSIVIADSARLCILDELGDLRLDQINRATWDRFIVALQKRELRSRTIQMYTDHLRTSLKVAVGDGLLKEIPDFKRPKLTDARPHVFLTPEQTEKLLSILKERVERGEVDRVSQMAIFLTVSMMFRKGETQTRRWQDISWEGSGQIRVVQVPMPDGTIWKPKTRGARVVPMTPQVKAALREWWVMEGRPNKGWLFPSPADPSWPLGDFRKSLETTCRKAGLPELHPHALRHTAATRLAWSGVDRHTTMALGGWRRAEMLDEVYSHTTPEHMAAAMTRTGVGGSW